MYLIIKKSKKKIHNLIEVDFKLEIDLEKCDFKCFKTLCLCNNKHNLKTIKVSKNNIFHIFLIFKVK